MARPMSRRRLLRHIESLEPSIRDEFLRAVRGVRDEANIGLIAELLQAGQVDAAATALGINAARFAELTEQVRNAYLAGGRYGAATMPVLRMDPTMIVAGGYTPATRQARLSARFDMRNPRAEQWLAEHSSRLVREIVADQRNLIRSALTAGMEAGRNPRQTALDIVGRVVGGRRVGGVVGLTEQQAGFVVNARRELSSIHIPRPRIFDPVSGRSRFDGPDHAASYFARTRRDRRFDGIVRRAIAAGQPVSEADIDRIVGRYSDRLLALRGEMIARTESITAFASGRDEAVVQAVEAGGAKPENVRKVWRATMDSRTRDAHAELNGQEVGLNEPFESPTGARLMHPGDSSMGAGPADVIGCRCLVEYVVDHLAEAADD